MLWARTNNADGGSRSEGGALSGRREPPIHEALKEPAVTRCWLWQGSDIDGIWLISEWFLGRLPLGLLRGASLGARALTFGVFDVKGV